MYVAGLCSAAVCALWWGPADVVEVAVSVMWRVVVVCGNRLGDTVFPEHTRRAAVVLWMCIGVVWYNREFVGACEWREDDTIVAEPGRGRCRTRSGPAVSLAAWSMQGRWGEKASGWASCGPGAVCCRGREWWRYGVVSSVAVVLDSDEDCVPGRDGVL